MNRGKIERKRAREKSLRERIADTLREVGEISLKAREIGLVNEKGIRMAGGLENKQNQTTKANELSPQVIHSLSI